ncbi:MAG: GIN domain-containing protein, partial [Ktedonobacterales bacterium]
GDMNIAGSAQSQNVRISGAGNYHASNFQTDTTDVTITGVGDARVSASQVLYATISGAGAVTYHGMPQVSQRITGVGSVRQG